MDSKNKARNSILDQLEGTGRDVGEVTPMSITARRCEPWGVAPGLTFFC